MELEPQFIHDPRLEPTYFRGLDIGEVHPSGPLFEKLSVPPIAEGLMRWAEGNGDARTVGAYITASCDYFLNGGPSVGDTVRERSPLPDSDREDIGNLLDLTATSERGVDPDKVLYFRVTQPGDGEAKPETYWTSDPLEVLTGLQRELGDNRETSVVLVTTLSELAADTQLMTDQNDNANGFAVRRMGTRPYDPQRAMFAFHGGGEKMGVPYEIPLTTRSMLIPRAIVGATVELDDSSTGDDPDGWV